MLFSHKRTIVFIGKEKIQWTEGRVPSGKLLGEVQILPWSEKNLAIALDEIVNKFPKKLRIVIGEEFSYVSHFQKNNKKAPIVAEAQALIPEKLQDGWDSREKKSGEIQIMAIQQKLFTLLKKEVSGRGLQVEAIEVESVAIARIISEEKNKCYIFAKNSGEVILGIVQDGEILATRVLAHSAEKKDVKNFIDYVSKSKNISIKQAFIRDATNGLKKIFADLKIEAIEFELDPMIGICRKQDISGRDKDVLNILLGRSVEVEDGKIVAKNKMSLREKILLLVFLLGIVGGSVFVYYVKKIRPSVGKKAPIVQQSVQIPPNDQPGLMWDK